MSLTPKEGLERSLRCSSLPFCTDLARPSAAARGWEPELKLSLGRGAPSSFCGVLGTLHDVALRGTPASGAEVTLEEETARLNRFEQPLGLIR